jgi:hypothetical protein
MSVQPIRLWAVKGGSQDQRRAKGRGVGAEERGRAEGEEERSELRGEGRMLRKFSYLTPTNPNS